MSQVINPNTQCYIGNVPFDRNYKNVLKFNNAAEQFNSIINEIKSHNYKEFEELNIIKPDENFVRVKGNYHEYQFFNYIVFRNTRYDYGHVLSQKWYFAFIDSVAWVNSETTQINYTIDIWQSFHLTLKFLPSFVERMHIPKSEDNFRRWQAPEPFNFDFNDEKILLDTTNNSGWDRKWVVETISDKINGKWSYEGTGNGQNYYGLYGFGITSDSAVSSTIDTILKRYAPPDSLINFNSFKLEDITDHRKDIVNVHQVPAFALENVGHGNKLTGNILTSLNLGSIQISGSLGNGYTPKNKKLLGALARAYVIFNKNGIRKAINPYKINPSNNSISLLAQTKPMGVSSIVVTIGGYTADENTLNLPYSASTIVGYNENSGIAKTINTVKAVYGISSAANDIVNQVGGTALTAMGISSGDVDSVSGGGINLPKSFGNIFNSIHNLVLTQADITGTSGNASDSLMTTPAYIGLKIAELNPAVELCKVIDDYLSTYGYAINEIMQPSITNRSAWNYIKLRQPNFELLANADIKESYYNLFESGITVWHSMSGYLDYSQNNN